MSEVEHISKPIERVMEKLENKKECTHITESDLQAISEAHQKFCQDTIESVAAKRQPDLKALIDFTSMAVVRVPQLIQALRTVCAERDKAIELLNEKQRNG